MDRLRSSAFLSVCFIFSFSPILLVPHCFTAQISIASSPHSHCYFAFEPIFINIYIYIFIHLSYQSV
uniref:Putative secreted peptide n=1 Tax=Anopheles braziliensis TaxID=58242 RepID=A0A2M3ZPZ7_9DIPT